jgi:vacuolar-type H+-ATPase subunit E/Vma4
MPLARTEALAPLASALLDRARRDAEAALTRADEDALATVAAARAEADALLADARAKGAADGAAVSAAERMRAERTARGMVLAAESAAREDLRMAAREAVRGLRHDPQYPAMVEALQARAERELGPELTVTELEAGGILAEAGPRRVEYSLEALADDLMDRLDRTDRVAQVDRPGQEPGSP